MADTQVKHLAASDGTEVEVKASEYSNKATLAKSANYPSGFDSDKTFTWGALGTSAYTHVTDWTKGGADVSFAAKDGRLYMQLDGTMYVNEGKEEVATKDYVAGLGYATSASLSSYQKTSDPLKEVIDGHPENGGALYAYYANDLIYATHRGAKVTLENKTNGKSATSGFDNMFDGTPSYYMFPTGFLSATTDTVVLTVDFSSMDVSKFSWSNQGGIGFGNYSWRAKSIKIETGLKSEDKLYWLTIANITNNNDGVVNKALRGPSANDTATADDGTTIKGSSGNPFNAIRFTLTNFNNTSPRIAQVWNVAFNSKGLANNFVQRIGSEIYGVIYPWKDNQVDLGKSSRRFGIVYANSFKGDLNGNAATATSVIVNDSSNQEAGRYSFKSGNSVGAATGKFNVLATTGTGTSKDFYLVDIGNARCQTKETLTIGSKTFDGSTAVKITASDLGALDHSNVLLGDEKTIDYAN